MGAQANWSRRTARALAAGMVATLIAAAPAGAQDDSVLWTYDAGG